MKRVGGRNLRINATGLYSAWLWLSPIIIIVGLRASVLVVRYVTENIVSFRQIIGSASELGTLNVCMATSTLICTGLCHSYKSILFLFNKFAFCYLCSKPWKSSTNKTFIYIIRELNTSRSRIMHMSILYWTPNETNTLSHLFSYQFLLVIFGVQYIFSHWLIMSENPNAEIKVCMHASKTGEAGDWFRC
jgi:hypothetical protein